MNAVSLSDPPVALALLRACTTHWEWCDACKKIKAANIDEDGDEVLPDWWYDAVVKSGLRERMHNQFKKTEANSVAAMARGRSY